MIVCVGGYYLVNPPGEDSVHACSLTILSDLTIYSGSSPLHTAHRELLESLNQGKEEVKNLPANRLDRVREVKIDRAPIMGDKSGGELIEILNTKGAEDPRVGVDQIESSISRIRNVIQSVDPTKQKGTYYLSALRNVFSSGKTIVIIGDLAVEEDDIHFEKGDMASECPKFKKQMSAILELKGRPNVKIISKISEVVKDNARRSDIEKCWREALGTSQAQDSRCLGIFNLN